MGSSRFLPLVIAGLIGLFVGWLFGPDVDDIEEAQTARFDQLDARVAAIESPLAGLQTTINAQASASPAEAIAALGAKVDAAAAAATAGQASGETITQSIAALQAKLDALAAAPPPAPPAPPAAAPAGGGKADALAAEIGNTGAVLLAGQTAIFGDKRLTVAAVSDTGASLGADGAAPAETATGGKIDLGGGCSVTLAGVSGTAAYLAPTDCSKAGAAAAPTAPAAPAPAAEAAPAAPAAPAPAAAAPAAAPPAAAPSPDGTSIMVGQTAMFGTKGVFLTRLSPDGKAFLFLAGSQGKGQIPVATGAAADLGDGCSVTLVKIDARTATFKATGCGGEAAAPAGAAAPAAAPAAPAPAAPTAPAPAPEAAPAPTPAAPAPAPAAAAPAAPAAPAPAAAAAPAGGEAPTGEAPAPTQATAGGPAALTIGQTATFGKQRVFLSRLTPEKAFVVVVGSGNKEVAVGAALDLGGGCSAKFDSINDKTANFTPSGC